MGLLAILGNIAVMAMRFRRRDETSTMNVQRVLILNLAVSDFLMGIYMLIIASVDIYYKKDFFWYSDHWRFSKLCNFAGFLALLSSEVSIFILTIISIERFIVIMFPFSSLGGRTCLRGKVLYGIVLSTWVVWISIALAAFGYKGKNLYGNSNVCIGLPFVLKYANNFNTLGEDCELNQLDTTQTQPWILSIIVFLVINSICLLIIFTCYITIFISVRRSRLSAGRDQNQQKEIQMAAKMGLIVGTDFCCWFPVITLGLLNQTQLVKDIPIVAYAWIIVFVLPLNSALNPYIYTINDALDNRRRRRGSQPTRRTKDNSPGPLQSFPEDQTRSCLNTESKAPQNERDLS